MSIDSLFGSGGAFGSIFSDVLSGISGMISGLLFLNISVYIILVLIFVVVYFMRGYTLLATGRKLGLSEEHNWMPFVPFARSAYSQRLLGEPDWKLFFWTDHMFYAVSFAIFLLAMGSPFSIALIAFVVLYLVIGRLAALFLWFVTMVVVLSIPGAPPLLGIYSVFVFLYLACTFVYRFTYTKKLYSIFGINPVFAVNLFIPFAGVIGKIFGYLIAFSDIYKPAGKKHAAAVAQGGVQEKARGQGMGSIVGVSGMYKDSTIDIPLGEEIVLGRDSAMSHVIIDRDADRISRKHCGIRFNPADGSYSVTDYSTNGTFKEDGSRLPSNIPVSMARGTLVVLGSRQTSFRLR